MRSSYNLAVFTAITIVLVGAAMGPGCAGETKYTSSGEGGGSSDASTASSAGAGGKGAGGAGAVGAGGAGGGSAASAGGAGEGGKSGAGGGAGVGGGSAASCGPAGDLVLAVNKLYIGDTNPDDTPNKAAGWKQYGFNVDGLVSTPQSVDLCIPYNGASKNNVYQDGNNGIDNSFGKNILPIFLAVQANFSDQINQMFSSGQFTILARLQGLGAGPDMTPLITKVYTGADLGSAPKLDGSDCWPVRPEGLADPMNIDSSLIEYDKSALMQNKFSSGGTATLKLDLSAAGSPMTLTIHEARISMTLDASHNGAVDGQIGGVLDTEEFVVEVKKVLGAFDPALCSGATLDAIITQIRQASDILKDGTQDTTKTCDGISIGLGFKMSRAGLDTVGPPTPPVPDPCVP